MPTPSEPPTVEGLAAEYRAGEWIAPHRHDAHQLIHAVAGVLRVISDDAVWVTPPGRAIWMPAGREHAIACRGAVSMRTLYVREISGREISGRKIHGHENGGEWPLTCQVWSISALMREIVIRLANDPDPPGRAHLLALLRLEIDAIDALPLSLPQPDDARLRRLAAAIDADPADPRGLRDWARALGFSERSLIRRFQAETGMSFRQWRRQARMLAALERLSAGASVTSVALDVGYAAPSAFIAAFRSDFGSAPGAYFR